jgi:hypothetical protein
VEGLTNDLVAAIAAELERRAEHGQGGVAALAERKDLEPGAVVALTPTFGEQVEKDRDIDVPYWPNVGHADLLVREAPRSERLSLVAELKWCGPTHDILYEGIWDMFKMALATGREEHPKAYLISGAEQSLWSTSEFADLFDDATHDPVELCTRRLPDSKKTLAWDDLLRGGYDRYPDQLPARIDTVVVGRATVGEWELRAVQVSVSRKAWITMHNGWPQRNRPEDARHPAML